jgi:hypothetical protein
VTMLSFYCKRVWTPIALLCDVRLKVFTHVCNCLVKFANTCKYQLLACLRGFVD